MDLKSLGAKKYEVTSGDTRYSIDLGLVEKHLEPIRKHLYENEELNTMKALILAQNEEIKFLDSQLKKEA